MCNILKGKIGGGYREVPGEEGMQRGRRGISSCACSRSNRRPMLEVTRYCLALLQPRLSRRFDLDNAQEPYLGDGSDQRLTSVPLHSLSVECAMR